MDSPENILNTHYKKLPLSVGFKRFMNIHKFDTLENLLIQTVPELLSMKGFNHRTLTELFTFLQEKELHNHIKIKQ